jgi:hypothetical protein
MCRGQGSSGTETRPTGRRFGEGTEHSLRAAITSETDIFNEIVIKHTDILLPASFPSPAQSQVTGAETVNLEQKGKQGAASCTKARSIFRQLSRPNQRCGLTWQRERRPERCVWEHKISIRW